MPRKIILGTIFPTDLNLNGDQANLLVLQKRLQFRSVPAEVVDISANPTQAADLIFIGHGSQAAWDYISIARPQVLSMVADHHKSGGSIMAVSSGAIKILELLGTKFTEGAHRSEFVEHDGIVGYINSPIKDFVFEEIGNSWFTMLHGPLLAKNPLLADRICTRFGWHESAVESPEIDRLDELAAASRRIAFEH